MTNDEKDLIIGYPVDAGELGPDGDAETQFLDWRQVIAERRVNLGLRHNSTPTSPSRWRTRKATQSRQRAQPTRARSASPRPSGPAPATCGWTPTRRRRTSTSCPGGLTRSTSAAKLRSDPWAGRAMRGMTSEKFSAFLERHSGWMVTGMITATLLLLIPLIALHPDEQASTEPGGPIFDLRDLVEERFPPAIYVPSYMLESPDGPEGDVLTQAALWELHQNQEALRRADDRGDLSPPKLESQTHLYRGNNPYTQLPIHGVYSVADGVQDVLNGMGKDLEHASDDEVKLALHLVFLENAPTFSLRESLSAAASFTSGQSETIGNHRKLPALAFPRHHHLRECGQQPAGRGAAADKHRRRRGGRTEGTPRPKGAAHPQG